MLDRRKSLFGIKIMKNKIMAEKEEWFGVYIEHADNENLYNFKKIMAIDEADAAYRAYLEMGGKHIENMEDITNVEDISEYLTEESSFPFILLELPTFEVPGEYIIMVIRMSWVLRVDLWKTYS